MLKPQSESGISRRDVIRRFDRAAADFSDSDFVHRHAFDGLIARMQAMPIKATRILDLGCAAGTGSRQIAKSFRRCHVTSLDISHSMLMVARNNKPRFSRISELRGDAMSLPVKSASMDLVLANMLLPWIDKPADFFTEVARVLRKDGLFVFTALGPASLSVLRWAWQEVDAGTHVNPFVDMHNVADSIVRAGLREPIVDTDPLIVSYRNIESLFRDLTATGARNSLRDRCPNLTGKDKFRRVAEKLESQFQDQVLSLELELIYGHAWGGGPPQSPGEFRLDPAQIGRRLR